MCSVRATTACITSARTGPGSAPSVDVRVRADNDVELDIGAPQFANGRITVRALEIAPSRRAVVHCGVHGEQLAAAGLVDERDGERQRAGRQLDDPRVDSLARRRRRLDRVRHTPDRRHHCRRYFLNVRAVNADGMGPWMEVDATFSTGLGGATGRVVGSNACSAVARADERDDDRQQGQLGRHPVALRPARLAHGHGECLACRGSTGRTTRSTSRRRPTATLGWP